jgi:hypothetical protein
MAVNCWTTFSTSTLAKAMACTAATSMVPPGATAASPGSAGTAAHLGEAGQLVGGEAQVVAAEPQELTFHHEEGKWQG